MGLNRTAKGIVLLPSLLLGGAFLAAASWLDGPAAQNRPLALGLGAVSRVNPLGRFASIKLAGEGPQVVAGDNLGAATRKVSHPATRSPISTEFS